MNINWDEMPSWADVWIEDLCDPKASGWHKYCEDEKRYYDVRGFFFSSANRDLTIHYPPETKPEWNGKDLPPVGTVCKYKYERNGNWCVGECKILGRDGDWVWFKPTCTKHRTMIETEVSFSPIKSDKEKWVNAAMGIHYPDRSVLPVLRPALTTIYDALQSGELPMPKVKE